MIRIRIQAGLWTEISERGESDWDILRKRVNIPGFCRKTLLSSGSQEKPRTGDQSAECRLLLLIAHICQIDSEHRPGI